MFDNYQPLSDFTYRGNDESRLPPRRTMKVCFTYSINHQVWL